ncbi:MAG TPA: hypothetical protein VL134_08405 [Leptolyngbya sp.]|jgi:hypothetical protein|nr:hypothetical protein [Leptolyngbya sp.]
MPLSPIAQYCIRKLIKQNIEKLNDLFVPTSNHSSLNEKSLDRILNHLTLAPACYKLKIEELELLASFYQKLEQSPANESASDEIKRRIFQMLGFQSKTVLPSELSFVVQESLIQKFRFFYQGEIQDGMRHENQWFGAVHQFDSTYRLQAYQIAWVLSEAKVPLLLSRSRDRLVIWVNLQSLTYSVLIHQNAELLKTVLLLNSTLRRWQAISDSATCFKGDRNSHQFQQSSKK